MSDCNKEIINDFAKEVDSTLYELALDCAKRGDKHAFVVLETAAACVKRMTAMYHDYLSTRQEIIDNVRTQYAVVTVCNDGRRIPVYEERYPNLFDNLHDAENIALRLAIQEVEDQIDADRDQIWAVISETDQFEKQYGHLLAAVVKRYNGKDDSIFVTGYRVEAVNKEDTKK